MAHGRGRGQSPHSMHAQSGPHGFDDDHLYHIRKVPADENGTVWYSVSARRRSGTTFGWAFRADLDEACAAARARILENEYWAMA